MEKLKEKLETLQDKLEELKDKIGDIEWEILKTKEKIIEVFKRMYNIDEYSIIKTPDGYARIDYFDVDIDGTPYAWLRYDFEIGNRTLGILHDVAPDDFDKQRVRVMDERELNKCVHFWVYKPTENSYQCKICGEYFDRKGDLP